MFIDVRVSLVDGINGTEFVNSFSSNNVKLYFATQDAALVSVRTDFLEEFMQSSLISRAEVQENESDTHDGAPAFPPVRYQQGTPTTTVDGRNYDFHIDPFRTLRPQFGSSDNIATQKAAIQNAKEFIYLGSHYMGSQMHHNKLNRMQDISGQTTRPSVGRSPYDNYQNEGPYGYSTDPVNSPNDFQYNSRFFGKNVDIIVLEPGNPLSYRNDFVEDDLLMPDHPEWKEVAENDVNVLGNDRPNLGDAPEGNYNHSGSRLYLQDYETYDGINTPQGSIIPSTGTDLGGKSSILSRYNNERLHFSERCPIDYHMAMCLSMSGGNMGGYAKRANLYPRYQDDGLKWRQTVENIISWHNSKPVNSETGLVNPTICSCSFHTSAYDMTVFAPIDSIKSINHLGVTTNRPAGGWGTNLKPFVDKLMIPYRFKNPTTNTWVWAIPMSGAAVGREGETFGIMEERRTAWERLATSGITVVASAGNYAQVYVRRDDPEYNDHIVLDENAEFFQGTLGSANGKNFQFTSFTPYAATKDEKLYPFRVAHRNYLRNTVILVGAGQPSPTFPGLLNYSNRGPAIDIIGDSDGSISAYTANGTRFPVDTNFGSGADINPSSSMYSTSVPFPFKGEGNLTTQTFANPDKGINPVWGNTVHTSGYYQSNSSSSQLYRSERVFTSDGASPQQNSWSTPVVIAQTGTTDNTDDNTIVRFAYRKNSNTQTSDTSGASYLNYTASSVDHPSKLFYMDGLEDEWVTEPPALTADGDIIYRIERVFRRTISGRAEHVVTSWSTPVIVGRRVGSQDQKTVMLLSKDENTIKFSAGEEVRITDLGTGTDVEKQNNWRAYLNTASISAGNFEDYRRYIISNLGSGSATENQSRWNTLLGRTDFQPKVWASDGPVLIPGTRYEIVNLGTGTDAEKQTNWNSSLNTTGVNYAVGTIFVVPQNFQAAPALSTATVRGAYAVGDTFIFGVPDARRGSVLRYKPSPLNDKGASVLGATTTVSYEVGDIIRLPDITSATPPASGKISELGFHYSYATGTSAAAPSVAGRLACIAEEYLHKTNKWPTTDELRNLLLNGAKQIDLPKSSIDWYDTPPASDAAVTSSQYHAFKSYEDVRVMAEDMIRDFTTESSGGLSSVNDFTTREGESKPSTLGWHSENISSSPRTVNVSTIASSIVEEIKVPEHDFSRYMLFSEQRTIVITTLTSGNTGFRDSNNSRILFNQGDRITVANGAPYLDNMPADSQACVLEYTHTSGVCTVKISHKRNGFGDVGAASMTWASDIPSDARNAFNITVHQLPTKTEGIKHYAQLKNESGQSNPASMYCFVKLVKDFIYKITVEADKPVNIELKKVVDGVVGETKLNYQQNVLGSGTITPEKARTSVSIAGQSGDRIFNTLLWEQMERAGFDFDKNGAADALTDGLLYLRYLFELRSDALFKNTAALNSPLSREEILENIRIAEQTFGDVDANGEVDALTDGLLVLRYLFNLTGDALISSAVAENATRTSADEIEKYIESQIPKKENVGTFGYRSFTNSAVANNRPSTNLEVIGEKVTANILDFENSRIEFDANHGIGFRDDFIVKHGEHPTIKNLFKNRFTNVGFIANNPKELLAETPGEYGTPPLITHEGPFNMVEIYKTDSTYPQPYVDSQDVQLSVYNCPVGLELFDSSYFVDAETSRRTFFENTPKPYTPYSGTSWRWTQETGQFFTSNMGALSTTTFTDVSGTSRTIDDMWWTNGQDSSTESLDGINTVDRSYTPKGIFCFSLRGTNIPNTAQTFEGLTVNGVSFKRGDAYYSSDSNGNSVWWWHITCRPFADSQFEKLGKSVSDWFIFSKIKNEVLHTPSDSGYVTYRLGISNIVNTTDYTTLVDLVSCLRLNFLQPDNHVHAVGETIPLVGTSGTQGIYNLQTMEPAGTIPLRAHYESGKILSEEVTSIRNFKNSKPSATPTVGATFPAQSSTLSATNDMTELETNLGLSKYGWQRTDPGVVVAENETITTATGLTANPVIPSEVSLLNEDYKLIMPSHLPNAAVPANGSFTVGPVLPSILPDEQEGCTVFHPTITYQWQKSTDGTNWTNIASNDSTYTNAITNTLTVTNYSNQDVVGEYYRCSISTTPVNLGTQFTNAVYAKSG